MKNVLFCLFALLFLHHCSSPEAPAASRTNLVAFADSLFQAGIDSGYIAGASVMVVRGDRTLLDKAYGYASLELETPMPQHASFEIGSITKQFTGMAILQLEQMGKLSLEDDFTKYLDFDTKGRRVTINQLLDHTSGIASYTEVPAFWDMSLHTYPRDTMLRMVEEAGFLFEPGEAMIYNNSAFFFLGLIIEEVADTSYEAFLHEHIFEPLEMHDTYYCSNNLVIKNKVYGYNYSPDGLQQKDYLDHTWPYAAGSLCSTTADLMKWLRAIHAENWPSEEVYQKLITPRSLNDGTSIRYAKGIGNWVDHGHPVIQHGGGINGFLSESRYYPEDELYVVVLVNTTGPQGANFFADQLTWQILEKKEYPTVALDFDPTELAGRYTGQVRGRIFSIDVAPLVNGITVQNVGSDQVDTLTHYAGDYTWRDGNDLIRIRDGEMRINQGYGAYYFLQRE